jgi:hypothetical protein
MISIGSARSENAMISRRLNLDGPARDLQQTGQRISRFDIVADLVQGPHSRSKEPPHVDRPAERDVDARSCRHVVDQGAADWRFAGRIHLTLRRPLRPGHPIRPEQPLLWKAATWSSRIRASGRQLLSPMML